MYTVRDKFAKRAHAEGLRARSAYKLQDIQAKFHIMKPGDAVLDLGCAPGSWSQVAAGMVGIKGLVIGIDREQAVPVGGIVMGINKEKAVPIQGVPIVLLQKDIFDSDVEEIVLRQAGRKFRVVLSDAAPNTSGIKDKDQQSAHEMSSRALVIACNVLARGGNMVIKVFQGPDTPDFIKEVKTHFANAVMMKPTASQKQSKEWYIVARDFGG